MLRGNKLLLALLLPVFILAFCLAAFALDEEDLIIVGDEHFTPEEWAAKQAVPDATKALQSDVTPSLTASNPLTTVLVMDDAIRYNPKPGMGVNKMAPATNLLFESFEDNLMPPTNWTLDDYNAITWDIGTISPYDGTYYAACYYDSLYTDDQDEWLISPVVDLTTSGASWKLEFYWAMSYYWGVYPYDNYDLEVWISTDGGANFTTMLWTEPTTTFNNYEWYNVQIDLASYLTETNVVFGFHYYGYDGAQGSFDYISVNDIPPPTGRCCYGDASAPDCADETQAVCEARVDWLSWDEGMDCTSNPCPAAGLGDNCLNPITATFPADFVSDQYVDNNYTCGRVDDYDATCMGYYDGGEDIIYEFTVTQPIYVDITLNPNGTTYTGFGVSAECPAVTCIALATNSSSTAYGVSNLILPAGTYYLMVDTWPSPDCISNYDLTIDYLGDPPAAPANDECADAETITIPSQVSGTTIGSTVDCPGLLDWNAVWYIFDVTSTDDCSNLTVDYGASADEIYTVGVILMNDCLCDDYILYSSIDWGSYSRPLITWNGLPDGTYYFPAYVTLDASDTPMDFVFDIDAVDCPPAPANDDCSGAEVITLGVPVSGSTAGATADCPSIFTDWYGVWYQFTLSSSTNCNDVSVSYCGSSGTNPSTVSATMIAENSEPDCCDANALYYYDSGAFDCANGWPQIYWDGLPDGTYYYIVAFGADPYDFVVVIDAVECPPPEPGDNCGDPLEVTINSVGDLPYVDNNYTCGRGDAESSTCLSYYDGGEDIFYEITVNATMDLMFTLDPQGTTYTAMALGTSCPPAGSAYTDCLAEVHGYSGDPKAFHLELAAGTYYLMIDTWPSPDCIPAFTLTIEEFIPIPGNDCSDPFKVNLPSDAPYQDLNQYTCGRLNDYSTTCMSYYDGGEDVLYEVNVDEAGYYEFILDPKGTTYSGMALGADCPLPGTAYTDCVAEVHGSSSAAKGFVTYLEIGTYYLMIDTWPSPNCIPDFDLFINFLLPPTLTYDKTMIEFCNVVVDDAGCTTLTLGNAGDVDLDFEFQIQYGVPPVKEIDGANITCTDGYVAGATSDITFTVTNASSDAEWITDVILEFPAGVTVNSATDIPGGGTYDMTWDGVTGDGITATWVCTHPSYGCIYSTGVGATTVNCTFDGSLAGPLYINYTLIGDEWGSDPHTVTGTVLINTDDPLYNWLSVDIEDGTIAGSSTQPIQVCYSSVGLTPGLYFASLVLYHNGGLSPITIPVTMTIGDDHDPAAIVAIDKSGSMALEDAFGDSRLERAKALAHTDIDDLLTAGYMVAVMSFNATEGMVLLQDFTTVSTDLHDAVDAIVDPRHDTPLAAAMCQAHCSLAALGCGTDALYTYTDGEENNSLAFDMCHMCDLCYAYHSSGWNYDCDPSSPATCTDWQMCMSDMFAQNGMNVVNYFGSPVNPFVKGSSVPADMYFLKFTAETSDGEFHYYADAAYIPGDANGDGAINVSDAVKIINYVFIAGSAPQPLEAGDANCDAVVNVSDAVRIINYIFIGGAAPGDCVE